LKAGCRTFPSDAGRAGDASEGMTMTASAPGVAAHKINDGPAVTAPVAAWLDQRPAVSGEFARDRDAFGAWWARGRTLLREFGRRPQPGSAEAAGFEALRLASCETRHDFGRAHAATLYDRLAGPSGFIRAERLATEAHGLVPHLVPTAAELAEERGRRLADKLGYEMDQAMLLSAVLDHEKVGLKLCHAMLLPHPGTAERLEAFKASGRADLGTARVERRGAVAHVTMANARFLNAEDDTTTDATEMAVDLALLDPATQICVLRGGPVDHPKYAGKRLFNAGINLTRLYRGEISFLFYVVRDFGFVNKMYRGVARPDRGADEVAGGTTEKLWIAAVEQFAIGGGCQLLLVMDYTLAARDAYATLPARKEGIIPGAANMRLPRFVGDRLARQAILNELRIEFDSPVGRMLCDELVEPGAMEAAVEAIAARLTNSGTVSAAGNRRALRVTAEPLDLFRRYYAAYVREQAWCHFSPALVANLERFWDAAQRRP
jgi:thioesterase DpgC